MKQTLLIISSVSCMLYTMTSYAQQEAPASLSEFAPTVSAQSSPVPSVNALWDVQFNYDLMAAIGSNGNAGVVYNGTTFWVSKWASGDISEIDNTGAVVGSAFQVSGVTGIRAMTFDGTFIYASQNTAVIAKINPVSKTQVGTIDISSTGIAARSLTYDPTANSGAGGLWVSNYGTDIFLIDMSGNVLDQLAASTHGLTAMYGTAFDNVSTGGPYLWVFDQGATGIGNIVQLLVSTGAPTGVAHDISIDVGSTQTASLAGGLSFTTAFSSYGSLVGVNQGTPSNQLFGYSLGGPSGIQDLSSLFKAELNVYPNPAKDFINIDLVNLAVAKYTISIFDITGKEVMKQVINNNKAKIDISVLPAGIYTIKAISDKQTVVNKFKIQK